MKKNTNLDKVFFEFAISLFFFLILKIKYEKNMFFSLPRISKIIDTTFLAHFYLLMIYFSIIKNNLYKYCKITI